MQRMNSLEILLFVFVRGVGGHECTYVPVCTRAMCARVCNPRGQFHDQLLFSRPSTLTLTVSGRLKC